MLVYHFLYDLLIFGVITPQQMFSPGLNFMQKFICCSFILLAGASARFSRSNLRHGIIVLLAGAAVEIGAAVGGQTIRFGILQFMGVSMVPVSYTHLDVYKRQDSRQSRHAPADVHNPPAHQRFSAGETDLGDPAFRRRRGHLHQLLYRADLAMQFFRHTLRRHTVTAPQIAQVCH